MLTGHVDVRETRALLLAIGGVILAVGLTSRASSALHWDRTHIEIAPGVSMPLLHLGWGNHTRWIASGGRGLDTAYDYGDVRQQDLGKALRGSGIDRSELFVCAAVWPIQCPRPSSQGTRVAPLLTGTVQRDPWRMHMRAYHRRRTTKVPCCPSRAWCKTKGPHWYEWPPVGPEKADGAVLAQSDLMRLAEHNFAMLGVKTIDLMLLHFPCDTHENSLARYRVLERLYKTGRVRAIGVSNFNAKELEALVAEAEVKPAVNQCGYSLGDPRALWSVDEHGNNAIEQTRAKTEELGITFFAYSALGSTTRLGVGGLIAHPTVVAVAEEVGRPPPAVALRWLAQQGIPAVTAGTNAKHMAADLEALEFVLSDEQMARLAAIR